MKNPIPVFASVTIEAGQFQIFSISVSDPDNDPLTLKWYVDNKKRVESGSSFNWTTSDTEVGSHEVKVTASDGSDTTSHLWSASVQAVNHPPLIDATSPSDRVVTMTSEGTQVFQVQATDPEGNSLIYKWTLDGVIVGSQEDYQYLPDDSSVGTHLLKFEVSDGELSAFVNWTVEVTSANQKPTIRSFSPSDGDRFTTKSLIQFDVEATDTNGDTLSYVWSSNIDGQLGKARSFTLQLSNGTHKITVTVSDGRGGSDSRSFTIVVAKPKKAAQPNALDDMGTVLVIGLLLAIVVVGIGAYFYKDNQRKQLELERAAALQRAAAAQKAAAKRKKPQAKFRPPASKPRPKEDMVQKAMDEEEAEMGDVPLKPKPVARPVQRVTIKAQNGPRPVKRVVQRPVRKDNP